MACVEFRAPPGVWSPVWERTVAVSERSLLPACKVVMVECLFLEAHNEASHELVV